MKDYGVFPRGMRPAAVDAVSERERMKAHPHRHQAGVNLGRALDREWNATTTAEMESDDDPFESDPAGEEIASPKPAAKKRGKKGKRK